MRTLHPFGKFIGLLATVLAATGYRNGQYSFGFIKYFEVGTVYQRCIIFFLSINRGRFFEIQQLHVETNIGFVVAVLPHGIFPGHAGHGFGVVYVFYFFENMFYHAFKHIQYIFLLYKGHFAIYLCELGLTVGPQVFVSKTFYYLIISIVTAYHQQLFKCLRRLWQCIKLSAIHTGRNNKISGTFGCGFDEERSFNIHKALCMQIISCGTVYCIAQLQIFLYCISSKVKIAIFHSQIIAAIGIILYGEWWHGRFV